MNVTFKNVKTKMEITHDDYMVIHQAMCDLMDVGNKNVFEPGEVDNVWKKLNEVRTRLAKNVAHDIVEQEYNMDIKDWDNISMNGIDGVDSIIDMIKDTIDSGDTEGAKDWLNQLQEHFNEVL